jgi:hypothetical protein
MGTIYRAIMPFLLLLSCAFAQYDFSDVRFRRSVDMRRATWMTLPTLAADPSGGCLFEDQVVKSAPTSTLWTCRNATWVQLSGSATAAVTGDTGTVTVNPANGKVDADITEIMARPLAPTSSFDARDATRTTPFKIVSTAPTVGAACPGLAGTFQMHTSGVRYRCSSSELWVIDGATGGERQLFIKNGWTNDAGFPCGATASTASGFADFYSGADAAGTTACNWTMLAPATIPASMTVEFPVFIAASASGNIRLRSTIGCRNPATTGLLTAAAFTNVVTSTFASPVTADLGVSGNATFVHPTSSCVAGSQMFVKIERLGADGADTYPNSILIASGVVRW